MTHSRLSAWALSAAVCAAVVGCSGSSGTLPDWLTGSASGANGSNNGSGNSTSVGDVVTDGPAGSENPGQTLPTQNTVSAVVRNESALRADVTLRFIQEETVVHLAFVRVVPDTVTKVQSPRPADVIELSGVDAQGAGLASRTFTFGVDFDEDTPAEYTIPAATPDQPPDNPPQEYEPGVLTMLEPSGDITLNLGSTLLVKWADEGGAPDSVVRLFLRPAGSTDATDLVPAGPAVGAALDGINDEILIVVQGVAPGVFDILGELDDGSSSVTSIAPGQVRVLVDPGNDAPSISILSPSAAVELRNGDSLRVHWDDKDEDDNATITFSLVSAEPTGIAVGPFVISPPIAEDPDGEQADSATLVIDGVLPGLYDLVATIDDGHLTGTARREGVVRIVAEPGNDTPTLNLLEPAADIRIDIGGSFRIRWSDSDANDNARISLMLDPDLSLGTLDGDEFVLVALLGEDDDGARDEITLGIPAGVAKGVYRVAGAITDGLSQVVTWAPGLIYFGVPLPGTTAPAARELALLGPSSAVKTRMGGSLGVFLSATNIPSDIPVRLFLDNFAYGGSVHADVTSGTIAQNQDTTLTLPASAALVPNNAWPRSFDLQAEVTVDGITYKSVAPGTVWVRQEVEITDVEMVNYSCELGSQPQPGGREFVGLKITWYGGGYQERETHADVQFWVSGDGVVPATDTPDPRHMVIQTAPESPNIVRVAQVDVWRTAGFPGNLGGDLGFTLDPDDYSLVSVVEPEEFGRIVSPAYPETVKLCYRPVVPEQP